MLFSALKLPTLTLYSQEARCKQRENAQRHKAGVETQAETDGCDRGGEEM